MVITSLAIKQFQKVVLNYYRDHARKLPWRETSDPYKILVSEIMLQQTQAERVITFYTNWLQQWPTINTLSRATRVDVLRAWMGLGYNNRALRLREAAKKIVKEYNGDIISAMKEYKTIPGIGLYTSNAVRIFSSNEDVVTVDTNIRRIFIHTFGIAENLSDKELWILAEQCLPIGKSRDWHNGLMDYGATLMTSRKTGIKPLIQQDKFEGSDRQIRSKIIRLLLQEEEKTLQELQVLLEEPLERLQSIIWKMIKEKIVVKKEKKYLLKE